MTNPKTAFDNFSVATKAELVAKSLDWTSFVDDPGVWCAEFIDCRYHIIAQNAGWEANREVFLDAEFNLIGTFSNLEQAQKFCQDDTVPRLAALTGRIREFCV
jgi:hypothetical protein